jgi:hypothetical protein
MMQKTYDTRIADIYEAKYLAVDVALFIQSKT